VLGLLFSLLSLHFAHDWPTDGIAMRVARDQALGLEPEQQPGFEQWLTRVLSSRTITRLAKAFDIAIDYQFLFHVARILTDIRPVFADSPDDLLGAVVTHTLKIDFYTREGHDELYVAMNDDDLAELERAVQRAKVKGESLRKVLKDAGLAQMDVDLG